MRSLSKLIFLILIILLCKTAYSQRTGGAVGSLPGVSGVSPSGAGTYDIPVWVCPGTNGMQPELNINYNSSRGNGMLGMGWGLTGLSSITRAAKDYQHFSTNNSGVNCTMDDRFMLDGNLLMVWNGGTYGANGTEYHTEMESYSKIVSHGQQANGPEWFEVFTKDGKILEYGNSSDSRVELPTNLSTSTPIYWQLHKVTDANGNYMTYLYHEYNGESLIWSIDYTGNANAGFTPFNRVTFTYWTNRFDGNVNYVAGNALPMTRLLRYMDVEYFNNNVRRYEFIYQNDLYSHLSEIKFWNGGGEQFNSTQITWGQSISDFNDISLGYNPQNDFSSYKGDFNGDGISDQIAVLSYSMIGYVGLDCHFFNRQGQFFTNTIPCSYSYFSDAMSTTADIDGDGVDEFIGVFLDYQWSSTSSGTVRIYKYNGSSFYELSSASITFGSGGYVLKAGDFDGNGKSDIFLMKKTASGSSDWTYYSYDAASQSFIAGGTGSIWSLAVDLYSMDFNGDGKTDLMGIDNNATSGQVFYLTPTGRVTLYTSSYITNSTGIYTGDFNGDAKTDLLKWNSNNNTMYVSYSDGTQFLSDQQFYSVPQVINENPKSNPSNKNFYVADFNGDGKDDVIGIGLTGQAGCSGVTSVLSVFISQGNNDFILEWHSGQTDCIYDNGITVGDFNGDGKQDLLNQHYNTQCSVSGFWYNTWNLFTFHQNEERDLVQSITNGFDVTDYFSYEPLTELAASSSYGYYTKGSGAIFPVFDLQSAMYVVNHRWKSDLMSNTLNDYVYSYTGAKVHRQGRGFLCFEWLYERETAINFIKATKNGYDLTYYYPYVNISKQYHWGGGFNFDNHYITSFTNTKTVLGNGVFFPYVSSSQSTDFLKNITTNHVYNYQDGNLITDHSWTANGFDELTTNLYLKVPATFHCENKLWKSTKVIKYPSQTPYTVERNFTYYPDGNVEYYETKPGNGSVWIKNYYEYNLFGFSCGKVNRITQSGSDNITAAWTVPFPQQRTSTFYYDNKYRYIIGTENALGQLATKLYDLPTGVVLAETDIDGLSTGYRYDGFAREIGRMPKRNAIKQLDEIVTTYEWSSGGGNEPTGCRYVISSLPADLLKYDRPYVTKYYDAYQRVLRTETEKLIDAATPAVVLADKVYQSGTGRLQAEYSPFYSGSPTYEHTDYLYSVKDGRVEKQTTYNAAGNSLITQFAYDNLHNKITTILPSGEIQIKKYNDYGNVIESTRLNETETFTYLSNGKPGTINGQPSVLNIAYDEIGNRISFTDPDAGNTLYQYDSFGQMTKQTDAKGDDFEMEYNLLGMLITKTEHCNSCSGGATMNTYNYNYNGFGMRSVNKIERIDKSDGSAIEYEYASDLGGPTEMPELKVKTVNDNNGIIFSTQYRYKPDGLLETATYPNNVVVKNHYLRGIMTKITNASNTFNYWITGNENEYGQPLDYTYGNGLMAAFEYDDWHYLTGISMSDGSWMQGYSFDAASGNLMSRSDALRGFAEDFTYVNHSQLQSALPQGSIPGYEPFNIIYGSEGNFEVKDNIGSYTYDPVKLHAVTEIGNLPLSNTISQETQNMTYSAFNKATTIHEGPNLLEIFYAPDNSRLRTDLKDAGGAVIKTKYFVGNYESVLDVPSGTTTETIYLNCPYGLVGALVSQNGSTPVTNYIRTDYLGSISAVYDGSASLLEENSFDAWGKRRNPDDWNYYQAGTAPVMMFERGYTGHEHLSEFELINMNGRMYDPAVCRMLSADNFNNAPLSTLGLNRYAYAGNNPLKFTDPSGHKWWHWAVADVLTGGAVSTTVGVSALGISAAISTSATSSLIAIGATYSNPLSAGSSAWMAGVASTGSFTEGDRRARNSWRIWDGLRQTDGNRTVAGQGLQLVSRFTWEAPQTALGNVFSQVRNTSGDVTDVNYYGGATIVNFDDPSNPGGWGATLGPYINGVNISNDPYNDDLFRHEYGHTLQSRIFGPLYLSHIAGPSTMSSIIDRNVGWFPTSHLHEDSWFETQANNLSFNYFTNQEPSVFDINQGGQPWTLADDYHLDYRPDWFWWFIPF